MEEMKKISSSPHVRHEDSTAGIMLDVLIALVPTTIMGIYNFGIRAVILILVCVATCVVSEGLFEYFMKRKLTIGDFSAVVTGLLLALNLPSTLRICNYYCKTAVRRNRTELCESGTGSKMLSAVILCKGHDHLYL